jgi:regulator of sigma E protease
MIETPGFLWTVISFFGVIGPLIFIHELGHYYAGRLFGVHAEAFSIGFGREVFGWTDRRGTRWKWALLPLGGYVKFAGDMGPASQPTAEWLALPAEERARTFQAKPIWQRAIIVAAGPAVNFLFAIAIFAGFFAFFPEARTPALVARVEAGSAAEIAGIRPGDRITSIMGRSVERFEDLQGVVALRPGQPMIVEIDRGGRAITLEATPRRDVIKDKFGNSFERGLLGISPGRAVYVRMKLWEVPGAAVAATRDILVMMVDALGQVISGERSYKEMGGPLKIAQVSGQQATLGMLPFIEFMAMISINLGFINLLPVPVLDGGHLMFYAVEAVRRRPLGVRAQEAAFRLGLAAILALMLFVTVNDLGSLGLWSGIAGLIAKG